MGSVSNSTSKKEAKQGFWSHFADISVYSWRSMLAHPWVLTFLLISNLAFVFLFAFYEQPLDMKIKYTLDLLSSSVQTIVQAVDVPGFIASVNQTNLADVIVNDHIMQQLAQDLILLLVLLAVVAYVSYTFFQTTSVRAIGWMILDKKPYTIWSFVRLNFSWFLFYLALRLVVFVVDMLYAFFSSGKAFLPDLSVFYVIIHVFLFYLVFISYALAGANSSWKTIKQSVKLGLFKFSTMRYYLLNFIPLGLYIIPATKVAIIVPLFNVLSPLGVIGSGLQLIILFFFYTFFVANVFTITYEVADVKLGVDE